MSLGVPEGFHLVQGVYKKKRGEKRNKPPEYRPPFYWTSKRTKEGGGGDTKRKGEGDRLVDMLAKKQAGKQNAPWGKRPCSDGLGIWARLECSRALGARQSLEN